MAYTKGQRNAILERDGHHCQAPWHHICNGLLCMPELLRKLQVHHILPQRYCEAVGIPEADFAENGLTVCKNAHLGKEGIHPDIAGAHSHEDFDAIFKAREEKLKNHEIYWDSSHDRQMHALAVKNTQIAEQQGWTFPTRGAKKSSS